VHVDLTDADLAQRIAAGDSAAEAELCRRMAPRIRLYGLRHLRSAAAADDLMQQVLVTVIEALRAGRLREADKVSAFVLGTCRLTVRDDRRRTGRQEELLEVFGAGLAPASPSLPDLDGERLGRCVQALPERERSVIVMTFYDEHTAAQSGKALGLSETNVRVIRHRAIRQLRTCMEAPS
jgi:RNA polymerase sigma-70 factor (ECF subfamily)